MPLVDHDRVEPPGQLRQPACAGERLHTADDDRRVDVVALGGDEPYAERERRVGDRDLLRRLAEQLVAVGEHQRARSPLGDQRREHQRLTASGRKHEERPLHASPYGGFDRRDRLLLVGAKRECDAYPRAPNRVSLALLIRAPRLRV
jgi:hypothetical protein